METILSNEFSLLNEREEEYVNGGGVTAFVYALGFMAGVAPVWVCVGGAMVLVGAGMCIYDAVK
ncbi:hypothetical protein [Lachnospira multipara]|uniref:Uncharacterized protein n=1 Tax=Lachnospira multipara TaxID=28051 RepID=A0A1H5UZ80_9FIRM|nr:hypothetical protein [Lachnospira multipara]SEF80274.1 hypothetical protein SAMN05216537_10920 [Lachnospira multipara]